MKIRTFTILSALLVVGIGVLYWTSKKSSQTMSQFVDIEDLRFSGLGRGEQLESVFANADADQHEPDVVFQIDLSTLYAACLQSIDAEPQLLELRNSEARLLRMLKEDFERHWNTMPPMCIPDAFQLMWVQSAMTLDELKLRADEVMRVSLGCALGFSPETTLEEIDEFLLEHGRLELITSLELPENASWQDIWQTLGADEETADLLLKVGASFTPAVQEYIQLVVLAHYGKYIEELLQLLSSPCPLCPETQTKKQRPLTY